MDLTMMERVGDRKEMEGYCSTDQSPQWAVVPVEEEVVVVVVVVVVKLNSLHRSIVFRPKARRCVLFINYVCCLHDKRFFAYFPFLLHACLSQLRTL
jgi:hypothetical protein